MILTRVLCIFLFLSLLHGCMAPPAGVDVLDVWDLPQNTAAYLDPATVDRPLWGEQGKMAEDYRRRHFSPWDATFPLRPRSESFWLVSWLKGKTVFGENRRPVSPEKVEALIAAAAVSSFPSLDLPAVTLRPSSLRALPSARPYFLDPAKPGEGFPFDYLQNSGIAANTPVRIRHRTPDGEWLYVDTAAVYGWLPASDAAVVDESFIGAFRTADLAVLIRDDVPVVDSAGIFRFAGRIGTFFPLRSEGEETVGLAAASDAEGRAVLREIPLPLEGAVSFPLRATSRQVSLLANRMLGNPYGWGDLYGNRDCSSTLRDLYTPFGVWLPRNSGSQAQAGRFVSVEKLPPEERERALLAQGIPWRTLVWMKGHIMLYIGESHGRPVLFHSFWGVRTRNEQGEEGRRVVGRTVITTLQPGLELPDIALPEGDLRERLRGFILF